MPTIGNVCHSSHSGPSWSQDNTGLLCLQLPMNYCPSTSHQVMNDAQCGSSWYATSDEDLPGFSHWFLFHIDISMDPSISIGNLPVPPPSKPIMTCDLSWRKPKFAYLSLRMNLKLFFSWSGSFSDNWCWVFFLLLIVLNDMEFFLFNYVHWTWETTNESFYIKAVFREVYQFKSIALRIYMIGI
jgi:hypothetical protein